MKRNPSKPKTKATRRSNVAKVFETITVDQWKQTVASVDYEHMLKRDTVITSTGTAKKAM